MKALVGIALLIIGVALGWFIPDQPPPDGPPKIDGVALTENQIAMIRATRDFQKRVDAPLSTDEGERLAERMEELRQQTQKIKAIKDPDERRAMIEAMLPSRTGVVTKTATLPEASEGK